MDSIQSYRPSGAFSATDVARALIGVLPVMAMVGAAYAFAAFYIPEAQLTTFAAVGAGLAVGFLTRLVMMQMKVRSVGAATFAGFVGGVTAWWASWIVWVYILSGYESYGWIWNPARLFGHVVPALCHEGVWELKSGPVKGAELALIWIIEAMIIIGSATLMALFSVKWTPFSETADDWATVKTEYSPLSPLITRDRADLRRRLELGDAEALLALRHVLEIDIDEGFTTCEFRSVPGDNREHFLTLHHNKLKVKGKRKPTVETEKTMLLRNLAIDQETHAAMTANFEASAAEPADAPAAAGDQTPSEPG